MSAEWLSKRFQYFIYIKTNIIDFLNYSISYSNLIFIDTRC